MCFLRPIRQKVRVLKFFNPLRRYKKAQSIVFMPWDLFFIWNFPDHGTFSKFFKRETGMRPRSTGRHDKNKATPTS